MASDKVNQARIINIARDTAQSITVPTSSADDTTRRATVTTPPTSAGVHSPRDWTTNLGMDLSTAPREIPESLQSIYEWFRANPGEGADPAAVLPSGSQPGGLRVVPRPRPTSGSSGDADESSASEYSSLLRSLEAEEGTYRRNGNGNGGNGGGAAVVR